MKGLHNELVHHLWRVMVFLHLFIYQAPFLQVLGEPVKKGDAPVSAIIAALRSTTTTTTTRPSSLSSIQLQQHEQQYQNHSDKKSYRKRSGGDDDDEDNGEAHIIYDQRQSGKYNIHVSIKDVAIIEMDDNEIEDSSYDEGDYYYNESDFTVKPLLLNTGLRNKTTIAPLSSSTSATTPTTERLTIGIKSTTLNGTIASSFFDTQSPSETPTTTQSLEDGDKPKLKYSPNLLADIAAAQGSHHRITATNPAKLSSISTILPLPTKKTQSVVILDTRTEASQPKMSVDLPATSIKPTLRKQSLQGRSKVETEEITISEPVLHPRPHPSESHVPLKEAPAKNQNEESNDSKIYKFKAQQQQHYQQQQQHQHQQMMQNLGLTNPIGAPAYPLPLFSLPIRRCRSNQYRDMNGNCRMRRSSSFLRKLFQMLITLPLNHERQSEGVQEGLETIHQDHNDNHSSY